MYSYSYDIDVDVVVVVVVVVGSHAETIDQCCVCFLLRATQGSFQEMFT